VVLQDLSALRLELAARGVPSRDVAMECGAHRLGTVQGMVEASERFVMRAAAARSGATTASGPILVGSGHVIAASARMVGPVVVHAGARIGEHATIVGPAVIGPRAQVAAHAVVAHAVVAGSDTVTGARTAISYSERVARVARHPQQQAAAEEESRARLYPRVKRLADATMAAAALLCLAPLLAIGALLLWLQRDGPVFYGDEREGVNGRVFKCWKFRTMRRDADAAQVQLRADAQVDGPHFKMSSDPRVTRVGRFLRASNLDEVPQLFNVLVGEMSLVGPRPSPFRENQICVPWRAARISVRPGITGMWQVCRHDRQAGDFHQWIEYDLLYVKHLGPMLDLKILLATLLTLGGKATHIHPVTLVGRRDGDRARLAA
jgi:lipopolysaccharide/colanic/teichoic acid biosynthesis glycosyltransferase